MGDELARPALTISDAAEATGKHRNTIRAALHAGRFPSAYREPNDGPWRIPVPDLIAAGYPVFAPSPPDPMTGVESQPQVEELVRLRAEADELRRRAEVAEAVAEERARERDRLVAEVERLWTRIPPALPERSARRWPWSRTSA